MPELLPKSARRAKFLTVLNLKGGVGKTTLAANIAASLGLAEPALKILLVDVDFQGTLGDATVERAQIEAQVRHNSFVNRLLLESPTAGLLTELAVPMNLVPGVRVILATDTLDTDEFQLQARFFLDDKAEPRYQFRKHFHQPEVLNHYDLVVFDCPPRVTTSVVNALACSDHVLIPTRLDRGSIDAVPRTYKWMRSSGVFARRSWSASSPATFRPGGTGSRTPTATVSRRSRVLYNPSVEEICCSKPASRTPPTRSGRAKARLPVSRRQGGRFSRRWSESCEQG